MPGTINRTLGSTAFEFVRLTPRDCMAATSRAYEHARTRLMTDLNDSGVDPATKLTALDALRDKYRTGDLLLEYLRSAEGVLDILDMSIAKSNPKPDDSSICELDRDAAYRLAAELTGYTFIEQKEIDDNDGYVRPTKASGATGSASPA